MPGRHTFDYAILPHSASDTISAYHAAYAFNTAFRSARTSLHSGPLPASGSIVEVTPLEFVVSAVKIAEDGSGLVVRGYNISSQSLKVTIKPWKTFSKASQVNLLEADQAILMPGEQGEVNFQVSAFQVASIKFSR